VYDLLFPTILLAGAGIVPTIRRRPRIGTYVGAIAIALLFMTQAFRIGFNFLPHRFMIYLALPLSPFAGRVWQLLPQGGETPLSAERGSLLRAVLSLRMRRPFPSRSRS
jgi:hypothetical protein